MTPGQETSPHPPSGLKLWLAGARPRTLPAAIVPVAVATAIAWRATRDLPVVPHALVWWRALCALVVSLAVQVATNYSNDYSDGKRGTDKNRVGPLRLVGSGLVPPSRVKMAAFLAFGVAAAAGLALAAATTWWLLPVGAACFAGGWFYTGGPKPYGYIGLGELFVLVFFGVVAVLGTVYVEVGTFPAAAIVTSLGLGSVATALLEANNLRDIDTDIESSKRTLAVRLGRSRAGWLYVGSIAAALVSVGIVAIWHPLALIGLLAAPLAISPFRLVLGGAQGRDLLPVLGGTARFQLAIGALLVVGFVL